MKKTWRKKIITIMLCVTCLIATSCGSKSDTSSSPFPKASMEVSQNASKDVNTSNSTNVVNTSEQKNNIPTQGKIIQNANLQLETKEFDKSVKGILDETSSEGGYVQSSNISGNRISDESNVSNRNANIVIRIPKIKFNNFTSEVKKQGNIISINTSTQDITAQYYDTDAHLKALKIQEERLLALLNKSGELKDIIELEKQLTDVRYQIESLTGTVKQWDNLVDYSTITIDVFEVKEITIEKPEPDNLGGKIAKGFTDSIKSIVEIGKGIIIVVAYVLPYLVIISILFIICWEIRKKKKNKKE